VFQSEFEWLADGIMPTGVMDVAVVDRTLDGVIMQGVVAAQEDKGITTLDSAKYQMAAGLYRISKSTGKWGAGLYTDVYNWVRMRALAPTGKEPGQVETTGVLQVNPRDELFQEVEKAMNFTKGIIDYSRKQAIEGVLTRRRRRSE